MKLNDLKFRAWAGKEKGMLFSDQFDTLSSFFGFIAGQMYFDEQGVHDYELMQWSGIRDKDGKLIFEGDILKYYLPKMEPEKGEDEYIEEVQFYDACFNVEAAPAYATLDWGCEVIGNIYQTP